MSDYFVVLMYEEKLLIVEALFYLELVSRTMNRHSHRCYQCIVIVAINVFAQNKYESSYHLFLPLRACQVGIV